MASITIDPVESSLLAGVGYDETTGTLAVQFKRDGAVYHYEGVPADAYAELRGAESIGSHFGKNIRSQFAGAKQEPEDDAAETEEA